MIHKDMMFNGINKVKEKLLFSNDEQLKQHRQNFPRLYSDDLTSPLYEKPFPLIQADVNKQEAVKEAFLHAYKSYKKYLIN